MTLCDLNRIDKDNDFSMTLCDLSWLTLPTKLTYFLKRSHTLEKLDGSMSFKNSTFSHPRRKKDLQVFIFSDYVKDSIF